jgi:hypothetical protein
MTGSGMVELTCAFVMSCRRSSKTSRQSICAKEGDAFRVTFEYIVDRWRGS